MPPRYHQSPKYIYEMLKVLRFKGETNQFLNCRQIIARKFIIVDGG